MPTQKNAAVELMQQVSMFFRRRRVVPESVLRTRFRTTNTVERKDTASTATGTNDIIILQISVDPLD
jgi:hypothetical protein